MKFLRKAQLFTALLLGAVVLIQFASAQAGAATQFSAPKLQEVWKLEGIDTPESVLEVGKGRNSYFLVSAIEGDFFTKDGKGSIIKISASGELLSADWVTGLNAPKGMATTQGKLYVADLDEIVVIDLAKATIVQKIAVPNA